MPSITKDLICIVCPNGCRMKVTLPDSGPLSPEIIHVEGNRCERGVDYARQEMTCPHRVLTTTVRLTGSRHTRLPVKTSRSIPKTSLLDVMRILDHAETAAPVRCGDVIVKNVLDSGADIVATRDME